MQVLLKSIFMFLSVVVQNVDICTACHVYSQVQ
jgi:hypothetical protein